MDIEQGTPEWHALRCGKVTASKVSHVIAKTKSGGLSGMRATYMGELIAERLTGVQNEGFASAAMQHGKKTEQEARAAYAFYTGQATATIPFIDHPTIRMSGASPDMLVGEDGLAEFKCPNTSTHVRTLLTKEYDADYRTQMLWQMACTGRKWCDFVSYDPRLPEHMRMAIIRVPRDVILIRELEMEVLKFVIELDGKVAELKRAFPDPLDKAA